MEDYYIYKFYNIKYPEIFYIGYTKDIKKRKNDHLI